MRRKLKPLYLFLREQALRVCGLLLPRASAPPRLDEIKNVLVIRIDRIGDLVLTSALVDELRERIPGAAVSVMAGPYAAGLVECMPGAAGAVVYDAKGAQRGWSAKKKFAESLRGRFDLVVDPLSDHTLETALLSYWTGARYRLGFDVSGRGVFFNLKIRPRDGAHFVDQSLGLLRGLGVEPGEGRVPALRAPASAVEKASARLRSMGVADGQRVIGIHPGGNYPSQRWRPERFAAAADELAKKEDAAVILFGGAADRELVNKTAAAMEKKACVWDGGGLPELAAALGMCDLLLCNNSGPLHLAASLGTPTVSTMGPTVPWMWWPRGNGNIVIRRELPCSPCGLGSCAGHECMESIAVSEVVEAGEKLLREGKRGGRGS